MGRGISPTWSADITHITKKSDEMMQGQTGTHGELYHKQTEIHEYVIYITYRQPIKRIDPVTYTGPGGQTPFSPYDPWGEEWQTASIKRRHVCIMSIKLTNYV